MEAVIAVDGAARFERHAQVAFRRLPVVNDAIPQRLHALGEFRDRHHPVRADRNAQVLQGEKAAVWMHRSQVDEHVPRFAPQSLQEFRKRVVEVLQGAGAQQDVLAVCMLHRVDEGELRSEEHTSELQSLMRISYAVFCLKKKKTNTIT